MGRVHLYKRGKVYYLAFARETGLERRSLKTGDRRKAEAIQAEEEHRLLLEPFGLVRKQLERVRLSELVRRFLEHKKAEGIAEGTLQDYQHTCNQFGKHLDVDRRADAVTVEDVEGFVRSMQKAEASRKTIRNKVFTLNNLFEFAVARSLARENPTKQMRRPGRVHYDPRPLSPDQFRSLMLVMKADPYFSDVVRFYLLTGIRRGDGPLLRKGVHVDLEARTLLLPQQKQRNTKRLMITDELLPVLRRLLAGADETGRFIHPHKADLSKRFTKYRKKAGLPAVITFHSLRHTFGSWLAQGGVGLATLQRLMGHSDARSTQGYVGAFDEGMRVALERLKLPEPGEGSHKYRTLLTVDLETLRN